LYKRKKALQCPQIIFYSFGMNHFLKNYCSTALFLLLLYWFYSNNQYFVGFLQGSYHFDFLPNTGFLDLKSVFHTVIIFYLVFLVPFYLFDDTPSKARIVIGYLSRKFGNHRTAMTEKERTSILAWCVKGFYAPLMILWLTGHIFTLSNHIYHASQNYGLLSTDFLLFFNQNFFNMAFSAILFFDVLFFTLGYLIEGKIFKNQILSVEPTMLGWVVALLCYPPFNTATGNILGWYSTDFPQFGNWVFHLFFNCAILVFMGIYSRASIALGLKASNLTNRGIVERGPYRFVRHPAYFCKNTAWWIGGLPALWAFLVSGNFTGFILGLLSLSARTSIYAMRALTEERHLSMTGDYAKYAKKVPYRFIPWVF